VPSSLAKSLPKPIGRNNYYQCVELAKCHKETKLKVLVRMSDIYDLGPFYPYKLIEGRAVLEGKERPHYNFELPCYVACGRWDRLRGIKTEEVDLVENFYQLLPQQSGIGLITCQNGIQNDLEDFQDMCNSVIGKLESKVGEVEQKPLFIGLYNPTFAAGATFPKELGFLEDMVRLLDSWMFNPFPLVAVRQMFATFSAILQDVRPNLRFAHVAHSEAGLFAYHCFKDRSWCLSEEQKSATKKHLITLVYGGVGSVPDDGVLKAINTYSVKDIAFYFSVQCFKIIF